MIFLIPSGWEVKAQGRCWSANCRTRARTQGSCPTASSATVTFCFSHCPFVWPWLQDNEWLEAQSWVLISKGIIILKTPWVGLSGCTISEKTVRYGLGPST